MNALTQSIQTEWLRMNRTSKQSVTWNVRRLEDGASSNHREPFHSLARKFLSSHRYALDIWHLCWGLRVASKGCLKFLECQT